MSSPTPTGLGTQQFGTSPFAVGWVPPIVVSGVLHARTVTGRLTPQ